MSVKLLTEHLLEFLSLKGGCRGSSESTLVKMPHVGNLMHWLNYYFKLKFIIGQLSVNSIVNMQEPADTTLNYTNSNSSAQLPVTIAFL